MITCSLKKIANITYGMLYQISEKQASKIKLNKITINSKQKKIDGSLFIAIQGKNFDGHNFIIDAIKAGVTALLVNHPLPTIKYPQIIVKDTCIAMGRLASWIRSKSHAKVIGITGSSGKTSVKEMVASILTINHMTLFTRGNFNNKIGVPLTLFQLISKHKYIVIEIGANKMNEIKYITNIIKPDSVLINNIYASHLNGFNSLNGVAEAKGEIFSGLNKNGNIIINLQSNKLEKWEKNFTKKQKIWFFSITQEQNSNFYAKNIFLTPKQTTFNLYTPIGTIPISLPLIGEHNISNAIAASALAISVGSNLSAIRTGLMNIKPIMGRLYPITIMPGKVMLDDTYNSNVGSMIAAINVLSKMPGCKILVASDMDELGNNSKLYHIKIGKIIKNMNFYFILTIGENSIFFGKYSKYKKHFNSKHTLTIELIKLIKNNNIVSILIKGSHKRKMKDIVYKIKEYFLC